MFIYLWLPWVFVAECRLSLVAVSSGYSLIVVRWFPMTVASLVVEARHVGTRASVIPAQSSVVVAHRLGCSMACEVFQGQGWNLCPLH